MTIGALELKRDLNNRHFVFLDLITLGLLNKKTSPNILTQVTTFTTPINNHLNNRPVFVSDFMSNEVHLLVNIYKTSGMGLKV